MKDRYSRYLIVAGLLLLAGCAGVPTAPAPPPATAEAQPSESATAPVPLPTVPNSDMSGNRAVIALLDRAQTDNDAGQHDSAGAALERALRIEPRNPWLWLALAQVRLDQGQYAQAITLARKSNSFAGREIRAQAGNWRVIGKARVAQGDPAGAEQAFKLSADLTRQAKEEDEQKYGAGLP